MLRHVSPNAVRVRHADSSVQVVQPFPGATFERPQPREQDGLEGCRGHRDGNFLSASCETGEDALELCEFRGHTPRGDIQLRAFRSELYSSTGTVKEFHPGAGLELLDALRDGLRGDIEFNSRRAKASAFSSQSQRLYIDDAEVQILGASTYRCYGYNVTLHSNREA